MSGPAYAAPARGRVSQPFTVALYLFSLMVGWYALGFSGVPTSDDEQLFASTARNLAVIGQFSAGQMYGNPRLVGNYHGVEPAHAALASLLYRLVEPTSLGGVQAMFLLNLFYTALTSVVVLALALRLGFSLHLAVVAALIFGLAGIAWPYSKTFFREPLAALLLARAWLSFETATAREAGPFVRPFAWGLFAVFFAGALLTKVMLAVAIPGFAILAWLRRESLFRQLAGASWRWAAMCGALALIGGSALALARRASDADFFYRFSGSFVRDGWLRAVSLPHGAFGTAIAGSLFSPGKGLLIYSPIIALAVAIPLAGWRWRDVIFPFSVLLGLLVAQALAYDAEWWNTAWGTRYLLPAAPLLIVACLPALEQAISSRRWSTRAALTVAIGLSILIQAGGALIAPPAYNAVLYDTLPQAYPGPAIWDPRYAALIGHWRLLLSGHAWDVAWWRNFAARPLEVALVLALTVAVIGLAVLGLLRALRGMPRAGHLAGGLSLALVAGTLLPAAMLWAYRSEPRYYADRTDLQMASEWVSRSAQPGDVIVIRSYLDPAWHYFMNFGRARVPWFSLPMSIHSATPAPADSTLALYAGLPAQYGRVWFLSERPLPDSPITPEESYLAERYPLAAAREFSSQGRVRVALYSLSGTAGARPAEQP